MNKHWLNNMTTADEYECYTRLDELDEIEIIEDAIKAFKGRRLRVAMDYLEERYATANGDPLFNAISEFDFYNYICAKYGDVVYEEMACFIK